MSIGSSGLAEAPATLGSTSASANPEVPGGHPEVPTALSYFFRQRQTTNNNNSLSTVSKFLLSCPAMALKAIHVSDVPYLDQVYSTLISKVDTVGNYPVDLVEFDVQVTRDGVPIIFCDNFIFSQLAQENVIFEARVTELPLSEFLSYGPQKEAGMVGKRLLRKTKDGKIVEWSVETDDCLCTLQEAFQKVFFLTNGGNEIYCDVRRNSLEAAIKLSLEGGLQRIVSEVRGILRNPGTVKKIKESKLSLDIWQIEGEF
ncbi:Hypothetical predicted protein [Olea europaea subsp. europaea]|uniref:glycerophosphodiester phosphodiesterase n=1 Tax=Olea europaea subsp. europaea TaxID=158383 RepID=A0A8S0V451_OLEEU|nr:Hypothetical predicted protein [Olea europaea subsp. europaea]